MLSVLLVVLMQTSPSVEQAAPRLAVETNIARPVWQRRPTGADLEKVYPRAALRARVQGYATLRCTVTSEGGVTDCAALNDAPFGVFGEAAVKLAPTFKMRTEDGDGVPVAGRSILLPIRFLLPR